MTVSPVFKRDMLWKPLLREFRRFIKAKAMEELSRNELRKLSVNAQGELLCQALDLPQELRVCPNTATALTMLLYTHKFSDAEYAQQPHLRRLRKNYLTVFLTSSIQDRDQFFSDGLLRYLWQIFRANRPNLIMSHIRVLPSTDSKNVYLRRKFLVDIQEVQFRTNCIILP